MRYDMFRPVLGGPGGDAACNRGGAWHFACMPRLDVQMIDTPDDLEAVRDLCRGYRALLAERTPDRPELLHTYYREAEYEALLERLPQLHARPDGSIFLARLEGLPVGCGMVHRIGPQTCEIKRVFATEAARGHGVGKAIFGAAMRQARADGYRDMKLDTIAPLTEAIGLYERLGFVPCAPFYDLPEVFEGYVRFYGRDLAAA